MTWGNENCDGSGFYLVGSRKIYFEKEPTEEEIQKKLIELEVEEYFCCLKEKAEILH